MVGSQFSWFMQSHRQRSSCEREVERESRRGNKKNQHPVLYTYTIRHFDKFIYLHFDFDIGGHIQRKSEVSVRKITLRTNVLKRIMRKRKEEEKKTKTKIKCCENRKHFFLSVCVSNSLRQYEHEGADEQNRKQNTERTFACICFSRNRFTFSFLLLF